MKKTALLLVLVLCAALLGGCGGSSKNTVSEVDQDNFFDFNRYKDADDIPDWKGEKLKISMWVDASNPNSANKGKTASNDVVTPEFERITGVMIDPDTSFDNAGGSYDAQIAKIIASGEYPDAVRSLLEVSNLIDKGVLWRLDDLIREYAPNVYRLFGPDSKVFGGEWNRQVEQYGGVYALSMSSFYDTVKQMTYKDGSYDLTEEQINSVCAEPYSNYGFFYIRDDILKKLYPNAKTAAELDAIYQANGRFTEEEIFDVPLESTQDFIDLLYKIKGLNLREDGKPLYTMFTHNGNDNWPVITGLGAIFGYHTSPASSDVSYFTYWDKEDKKIHYTFKEPWFKEVLKTYNKLVRDDVAAKEALVDTNGIFNEKLNGGRYVISYSNLIPNENMMKDAKYAYRKVYVKQRINTAKFTHFEEDPTTYNKLSFFNTRLSKNQMIQLVRMLDFVASDPGQKLHYWGPRSAGLYMEKPDGTLKYTDGALEKEVFTGATEEQLKYNLQGRAWPGLFGVSASRYLPKLFYTENKNWKKAFSPGYSEGFEQTMGKSALIYQPEVMSAIPGAKRFWQAREGFENTMVKVFAAASDSEFESQYQAMVSYAESNGLTDETLEEFNRFYRETYNQAYMQYLD